MDNQHIVRLDGENTHTHTHLYSTYCCIQLASGLAGYRARRPAVDVTTVVKIAPFVLPHNRLFGRKWAESCGWTPLSLSKKLSHFLLGDKGSAATSCHCLHTCTHTVEQEVASPHDVTWSWVS